MGISYRDTEVHDERIEEIRAARVRAATEAIHATPLDSPEWAAKVEAALRVAHENRMTARKAVPLMAVAVATLVCSSVWPWGFL
jgi:hypothetical protein